MILATQIPGFRYANTYTNTRVHLPRRVDHDFKLAEELASFITLNRHTKIESHYEYLQLGFSEGKRLGGEMKRLLKEPPLIEFVEQPSTGSSETKKMLIRMACYMLVNKGWGDAWFGRDCSTAKSRTLFWPADSSILLASFVILLYRMYNNQRQIHQTTLRIVRSHKGVDTTAQSRSSTRSPPVPETTAASETPTPAAPDCQAFFAALAQDASAAKKRKRDESVLGIATPPAYDLEIPANAKLKYHVYVKDKTDGSDLAAPTVYRHTDYMIARGAFASLKSAFESAGQAPVFEIQTPSGRKSITSEDEWEHAVLAIYNARRSGGVVEVDVFV